VVSHVRVALSGARVYMYVDVYQTRRHIETGNIDHLGPRAGLNVLRDLGDLVVPDRHVAYCVDSISGVDDVTTLEHKIVGRLSMTR
jgi:hypothetical protein